MALGGAEVAGLDGREADDEGVEVGGVGHDMPSGKR
jgi:hypothetical protein